MTTGNHLLIYKIVLHLDMPYVGGGLGNVSGVLQVNSPGLQLKILRVKGCVRISKIEQHKTAHIINSLDTFGPS